MNTLIVQADSKVTKVLITIYKALKLSYEIKKEASKEESLYDAEFVKLILDRSKNAKKGNVIKVNPNDLWGSLGLK